MLYVHRNHRLIRDGRGGERNMLACIAENGSEREIDDGEVMLNVLTCHLTY